MKKTTEYTRHKVKRLSLVHAFIVVLAIGTVTAAAAATRHVSTHGHDTGNCRNSPCRTIGYAVGQANPGDLISVAGGTYAESVAVLKRLTLIGNNANDDDDERENDRGNNANNNGYEGENGGGNHTTIDATGHDNGILISGSAASGTVVRGFTIRNATLEGILAQQTSNLTIAKNRLFNNDRGFFFPVPPPFCGGLDDCGEAIHLFSVSFSRISDNLVQHNVGGILLTDEVGPTNGNIISDNDVLDNQQDCGITLASHFFLPPPSPPVAAGIGGVYDNLIINNTANRNGAAGIGVFAGPPGAAAYHNFVIGNTARNNGLPGVAIHSHTPFQNANGNVIFGNTLSGNGPDDDAMTVDPAGVVVWSAVVPISNTFIGFNRISNEHFGIYTGNAIGTLGLPTNIFHSVAVPISVH